MALKLTPALANLIGGTAGFKESFTDAYLYIFSGSVPDTAEEALDMVTDHTELVIISGPPHDATVPLEFEDMAAALLAKETTQVWSGEITPDGFVEDAPLAAQSFYRLCNGADNGRALATTEIRVQGTCGGPGSGADLQLGVSPLTIGEMQPVGAYSILFRGG